MIFEEQLGWGVQLLLCYEAGANFPRVAGVNEGTVKKKVEFYPFESTSGANGKNKGWILPVRK